MKQHVAKVTCFYQLRRLHQIRRRVGAEVTNYATRTGFHHISARLLQLRLGQRLAVHMSLYNEFKTLQ